MMPRLAYIRVAIQGEPDARGFVRAFTVNNDMQAFDGAGFDPGMVKVHQDAIAPAPIEQEIAPCQLYYGGKKLNRVPRP
jgi:hypothetical protein